MSLHDSLLPDFIADIRYRTPEEGGRKACPQSGYKAQIKFSIDEMQTLGLQDFANLENAELGKTIEAYIRIIATPYFKNRLWEGMKFTIREGATIVGDGIITKITNNSLKK